MENPTPLVPKVCIESELLAYQSRTSYSGLLRPPPRTHTIVWDELSLCLSFFKIFWWLTRAVQGDLYLLPLLGLYYYYLHRYRHGSRHLTTPGTASSSLVLPVSKANLSFLHLTYKCTTARGGNSTPAIKTIPMMHPCMASALYLL